MHHLGWLENQIKTNIFYQIFRIPGSHGPKHPFPYYSWERKRINLDALLASNHFKSISYARPNRPGGGCAIIYNEERFKVTRLDVDIPDEVEAAYALLVPIKNDASVKVKRIVVGSFYVSPKSRHKSAIIEHIIETIHLVRARFDNEVNFILGGDFNRLNIDEILDAYGALNQLVLVPTRQGAILEIILTDLHSLYHPPTTFHPLRWIRTRKVLIVTTTLLLWPPYLMEVMKSKGKRRQ